MFNHLELIATTIRFSISVSFSPQPSSASRPQPQGQKQRQPKGERATPFPPGTSREQQGRVAVSGGFRAIRCAQIIIPSTTAFSQAGGGSGSSAGSTSCSTSCLRRQPRTLHFSSPPLQSSPFLLSASISPTSTPPSSSFWSSVRSKVSPEGCPFHINE